MVSYELAAPVRSVSHWRMKTIGAWLLLALIMGRPASGKEPSEGMAREEALKFCRTLDGKESGSFWFEHGDKEGPYHHAGRIILSPGEEASYAVADADGDLSKTGLDVPDGAAELHMDFFTGKSGHGWVVTHSFKPEIKPEADTKAVDKRSDRQKALGAAAELAIKEGNLEFLKMLVGQGLELNQYLNFEEKTTALSTAVWEDKLEIAKYLLEHGANKDFRGRYDERPITTAFDLKRDDLCKLLARPDEGEKTIAGTPTGLLEEIFCGQKPDDVFFVRWKDEDPPEELMGWLKQTHPNARPASRMETLDRRPLGARTWYRDKTDGKFGPLMEISIESVENDWKVRLRQSTGPFLAGGGNEMLYTRHHGYWMGKTLSSWCE